jgi:TolB protein
MKKILLVLLTCLMAGAVHLQAQTAVRKIGQVDVNVDSRMLGVQVSANTPELDALARRAFSSHGRYNVVPSNGQFIIKFTQLATNQVKVDVLKGGSNTPVHSQVVTGTSNRNALLKAADVAVEKTNLLGLKGFFASKLVFISERTGKKEVYVSDLFMGEVRQITHDNALALSPRWAPDGSRIIYTSFYKSGFPDIFQINMSSYQRDNFASFKGTNSGARFSPNGQSVAMVLSSEGNPEIYVGNAQGKMIRRITRTDAVEASPCFSPDSSRIVYTCDSAGGPQLYVISANGGAPQRLVTGISGYCAEPDWSRDGKNSIAFTAKIGGSYQIAVYQMGGKPATQVSKARFDAIEPSWLADGRHLIYTARDRSTSVISILDTVTGKSMPLSSSDLGQSMQASVRNP